jgi:hypothetical protein
VELYCCHSVLFSCRSLGNIYGPVLGLVLKTVFCLWPYNELGSHYCMVSELQTVLASSYTPDVG